MKLIVKNISCTFNRNTPLEIEVLHDVSADFEQGEMVAIIGHSGSGKTTLVEHLNCLLKPQKGEITFEDLNCRAPLSFFKAFTKRANTQKFFIENITFRGVFDKLKNKERLRESVWVVESLLTYEDSDLINSFLELLHKQGYMKQERARELCFLLDLKHITSGEQTFFSSERNLTLISVFFLTLLNSKLILLSHSAFSFKNYSRVLERVNSFYGSKLLMPTNVGLSQTKLFQKIKKALTANRFAYEKQTLQVRKDRTNNKLLKFVRRTVGVVHQFAEHQLFKTSVAEDVMFGALRMGNSRIKAEYLASKYIKMVGLDESFLNKSPFNLSGGQKRRVAIAGVLAMEPDFLIFDEPTAGLDPEGIKSILQIFKQLNQQGQTVIICTHDLDNVLK